MTHNASDRKSIRRAEKDAAIADRQRHDVTREIMSTRAGREWMWNKLSFCHIFDDPFTNEALLEAYRKGERNVGLALLADIMLACPDQYITAMRESNERHISNNRSPDDPSASSTNPLAERRGSSIPDGGDLGAEPDSGEDSDPVDEPRWNPGADIYATGGPKQ